MKCWLLSIARTSAKGACSRCLSTSYVSEFIEDCRVANCTLWRRSRPWRSASSRFPMTGNLKLKIGQIVLVLIACRTCGMLALVQSHLAKKEEQEMRSATLGVQWCMMRQ